MKTYLKSILSVVSLLSVSLSMAKAQAAQRVYFTSHALPFYAKFEPHLIHTDGQWAAIAFYRPPECIRPDFNLMQYFDIPAAFGCTAAEPYVVGFGIWSGIPDGVDPVTSGLPPFHSKLFLNPIQTMPIWFVALEELEAAITDGVLTIGELVSQPSLQIGDADFFTETFHPLGGGQQIMDSLVARGKLLDGRSFFYSATESQGVMREVKIEFQ